MPATLTPRPDVIAADSEALRWCVQHRVHFVGSSHQGDWPADDDAVSIEWDRCGHERKRVTRRPDFRAALDAAMRGEVDTYDDFGATLPEPRP